MSERCCEKGCERCDYLGYFRESRRDLEREIRSVTAEHWKIGDEHSEAKLEELYSEYARRYGEVEAEDLGYDLANTRWG